MVSFRTNRDRQPGLTRHKASGQGVVRINGKDVYCGPYGTPECRARYLRALAEWEAAGRRPVAAPAGAPPAGADASGPDDVTVNELLLAYRRHAEAYYVKNGRPTSEVDNIRLAIRPLRQLFGDLPAREFGPLQLKTVRQAMAEADLCLALRASRHSDRLFFVVRRSEASLRSPASRSLQGGPALNVRAYRTTDTPGAGGMER